jgi:hypothetical protein
MSTLESEPDCPGDWTAWLDGIVRRILKNSLTHLLFNAEDLAELDGVVARGADEGGVDDSSDLESDGEDMGVEPGDLLEQDGAASESEGDEEVEVKAEAEEDEEEEREEKDEEKEREEKVQDIDPIVDAPTGIELNVDGGT